MVGALAVVPAAQAQQSIGLPWWFWLLLLVLVIALFIWWLRRAELKNPQPTETQATEPTPSAETPSLPETSSLARSDEPEALADSIAEEVSGTLSAEEPPETQPRG